MYFVTRNNGVRNNFITLSFQFIFSFIACNLALGRYEKLLKATITGGGRGGGRERDGGGRGGGGRVCSLGIYFTPLDLLIVGISFGRLHAAGLTAVQ